MSYKLNPFTGEFDYFEEKQNERLETTRTVATPVSYGDPLTFYGDAGLYYGGSANIAQFQLVTAVSSTEVILSSNLNAGTAKVLGIALEAGTSGDDIRILLFGLLEDPFFAFPLNDNLYLDNTGNIVNVEPTTPGEYITEIGYSLGTGSIWTRIEDPELIL